MDNLADTVLTLAVVLILATVIPWVVIKFVVYALVVVWMLGLVVFGLAWAHYHYKNQGR